MSGKGRMSCQGEVLEIPLAQILPLRTLAPGIRKTGKYQCIEASIRELGLIEPLVVYPQTKSDGDYILLDGHVRYLIMKELGIANAKCLISLDDEAFTYNHKVSRLTTIQEHFMILKAIKNGVPEVRIARALDVDVGTIRRKRDLLDGICPEAVQLLRDRRTPEPAFRELRKVKPMRQIEIAELMCAADNFSIGYTKCLVASSHVDQLIDGERAKEVRGLSPEGISKMEHEMESLGREFKLIEITHGKNVINLVVVVAYLKKLMANARVVRFLTANHPEIVTEFQKLVEAKSLQNAGN